VESVFYNDNEPYVCEWLRNLIAAGHLPEGEVDGRDIREVSPDDLKGYEQAHFFAGIGGWPYALKLAGWKGPVWTASIPCQPLSSAGRRKGHADERHLWPAFHRLVTERRPPIIFGEQVASKDGREWLAGVRADLEDIGYAVGAADLSAVGVGAPHIRQRLWWGATNFDGSGLSLGDEPREFNTTEDIFDSWRALKRVHASGDWATREAQSSVRVFVDGVPARVGQLRAYGNAIVPQVAAEFIKAFMEASEI